MEAIRVIGDKLVSDKKPDYIEELGDNYQFGSGIYLHGELEDINRYDLTLFPDSNIPEEDGVYDVSVKISDTEDIDAVLYLWFGRFGGEKQTRGLIVMDSDKEGSEDARKKYLEKTSVL